MPRYAAKKLMYELEDDVTTSYERYRRRNAAALAAFDGLGYAPNLHRIYPADVLCNGEFGQGRCGAVLNGVPLYYDDDHLSNAGARLLAAEIVRAIASAQPWSALWEAAMQTSTKQMVSRHGRYLAWP